MKLLLARLQCFFQGHSLVRVPVDPEMKQNTFTIIRCVFCLKQQPDNHLDNM